MTLKNVIRYYLINWVSEFDRIYGMDVFKQISGRKGAVESRFFLPYVLFPRYLQLFFLLCTIRKIQVHTIQLCPQFWQMATVLLKVLFPYIFKPPRFLPPNNKPHHQPIVSQYRGCSHQPKHNQYRQPWLFFAGWITTLFVPAPKFPVCSL